MAITFEEANEKFLNTCAEVISSPGNWKEFLNSASRNYRLRFDEQILIFSQKPNATAVLEANRWSKHFGRWVKRNTEGIAVFTEQPPRQQKLKYYFDISDTIGGRNARNIPMWQMNPEYIPDVIAALNENYDNVDSVDATDAVYGLADALYGGILSAAGENDKAYIDHFKNNLGGSLFENMNESTAESIYISMVLPSIVQSVFSRADVSPAIMDEFYKDKDLENIVMFNTPATLLSLGSIVQNTSSNVLQTVARTINAIEKQKAKSIIVEKAAEQQAQEEVKNSDAPVATAETPTPDQEEQTSEEEPPIIADEATEEVLIEDLESTADMEETVAVSNELEWYDRTNEDKSLPFLHEDDIIHEILATTPFFSTAREEIARFFESHEDEDKRVEYIKNIFNNDRTELTLSDGNLYGYKTFRNVLHIWKGPYDSKEAQAYYDWAVIARFFEAKRLLGKLNDVTVPVMSLDGQMSFANLLGSEEKTDGFIFSQEIIDAVLRRGSLFQEGKFRIYDAVMQNMSTKDLADFLKEEYGIGGTVPIITGIDLNEDHDFKGIKLSSFKDINRNKLITWNEAAKRISELVRVDRYLTEKEKERFIPWKERQEQKKKEIADTITETETAGEPKENSPVGNFSEEDDNPVVVPEEPIREETETTVRPTGQRMCDVLVIGDTVYLEDAPFIVDSISDWDNGDVTFADPSVVYPIFRAESKERLDILLRADERNDWLLEYVIAPPMDEQETKDVENLTPVYSLRNYSLIDADIPESGGDKEKFWRNVKAIATLKQIEQEKRVATPEEQYILAQYVGWGGLPDAFDPDKSAWAAEYEELKELLTPDEYASARESTLSAFFTPRTVVFAVYDILDKLNFKTGNILEPSCGIGNFIGMLPEGMNGSRFYGVELDRISAGIAHQLYQTYDIQQCGFEEAELPDSFFDAVVGNVPFGDFKVADKKYDKYNFLIHDYFFAKSLDKLRPNGVMVLLTSKGTMDKANSSVRRYLAQRADLLGAIRLPNNTFKANAGTEAVSDILILQKKELLSLEEPDWCSLDTREDGIKMNSYFVQHPEMILGEMKEVSGRFGPEVTCVPFDDADLSELLRKAVENINGEIPAYEADSIDDIPEEQEEWIPADPGVRNFSFTITEGQVYFRENSRMKLVTGLSAKDEERVRGLIKIRDSVRRLIELQTEDYPDEDINAEQDRLNGLYDEFTKKYGLIYSKANQTAFSEDCSLPLIAALENVDEDGKLISKAAMFTERTINPHKAITSVDTPDEALIVSMNEKGFVDMEYMCSLTGQSEEKIFEQLSGKIFLNPEYNAESEADRKYLNADEYLSGNVRAKLREATAASHVNPVYDINVAALEVVQPEDLSPADISVRLGAVWIPPKYIKDFIFDFLETPRYLSYSIDVWYSPVSGEWRIEGKSADRDNIKANVTYGTKRASAYKIIEETLNLKDMRIFDYIEDVPGHRKAVLNKEETALAQAKQEEIKQGFADWIWSVPHRRQELCKMYNEEFNCIRPREYDGSYLDFPGQNPSISLMEHQRNAIAHILFGGNTLLAHSVGAGKTFEMVTAAMELKRLGLCHKSLFVVPNHIIDQWGADFMRLYPAANILVATKKDFEKKNRKKFCGRIATGEYDAVIIGHSQFEKIPVSLERQRMLLERQIDEITQGIADLKYQRGESFSIKQMEKTKKALETKLKKLLDQDRKDDVVTFEELGIDRLFIDESHYYKNLYLYTKMRNVGGIAQTEAIKSSDLFMKCQYLDEITGGRGTVFATGTPISNSMVELYTIQRYLQYGSLQEHGLQTFDSWASTFGETVTAIELAPEGTGYRAKTRFAKFFNLPELMNMFKEVADIKTPDMLNLPVPDAKYHVVELEPSEIQQELVASLSDRADRVRNRMVNFQVDNMLKITNDGRKLALDQRLIDPMLPDYEGSKVNSCVEKVYNIWKEHSDIKATQMIFSDMSTPKNDGSFNVYDDIRNKLVEKGIPKEEIVFIHEAQTEAKKQELFKKVNKGDVRVLLGSTQKMGAGTNAQERLYAIHDLDCPWRPSDLEQRAGRVIRQGNTNEEVHIYRYVTKQTFDAYLYQLVEGKQRFISQIMTSKEPTRSAEDIDETVLSYAEIKMCATGDKRIQEKMELDIDVQKLNIQKKNYLYVKYDLEEKIAKIYPNTIRTLQAKLAATKVDAETVAANPKAEPQDDFCGMEIYAYYCDNKRAAGEMILKAISEKSRPAEEYLGRYRGFEMTLSYSIFKKEYTINVKGKGIYSVPLGTDVFGNITRLDNCIDGIPERIGNIEAEIENTNKQLENAKVEVVAPFAQEEILQQKLKRLNELNAALNIDAPDNAIVDESGPEEEGPRSGTDKTDSSGIWNMPEVSPVI